MYGLYGERERSRMRWGWGYRLGIEGLGVMGSRRRRRVKDEGESGGSFSREGE